mmetsp:Transcript_6097/g.14799  ORF Transcript_6097/g.14799 Transcript_6097/m.14799 type:complete len:324 (-) Transcript_6097:140-1111(-)
MTLSILVVLAEFTILKLPKIENKWWVTVFMILYFFESYNCTTRIFLSNTVSNTTQLDAFLEGLKQESPVVTWKVQTFHYELRRLFAVRRMIRAMMRSIKQSKMEVQQPVADVSTVDPTAAAMEASVELPRTSSRHTRSMFPFTRRVVTNEASAMYRFASFTDKTMVGVWVRAPSEEVVPFQKISLSKVLVLSDKRSREDYFRQQSEFVTRYGREDEFAEFSTDIEVTGYRPRLLVADASGDKNKNNKNDLKLKLARLPVFWAFTCLGLTVPYRVWFKRHCDFLRVTVVKETKGMSAYSESYLRSWFPVQGSLHMSRNKKTAQE